MKRSLFYLLFILSLLLMACGGKGNKQVKLTSTNYTDYLEVKFYTARDWDKNSQVVEFNIKSKNEDYIFNDVEGIIKYSYSVTNDSDGQIATYIDKRTGNEKKATNLIGSIDFQLDRYGTCTIKTSVENDMNMHIPANRVVHISNIILEFKSGTVSKKELEQ